jgi:hypothetical protein
VTAPHDERRQPPARWFVPALVVGWALIGVGVWSALQNTADANPGALLKLVVGFDLLHDLVFAPLLVGAAWLIARLLPEPARGPCRVAGALTVLIVLFSRPLVAGYGRRPTNSSALPHDYGHTVLLLLVAVWTLTLVFIAVRALRRRRT